MIFSLRDLSHFKGIIFKVTMGMNGYEKNHIVYLSNRKYQLFQWIVQRRGELKFHIHVNCVHLPICLIERAVLKVLIKQSKNVNRDNLIN